MVIPKTVSRLPIYSDDGIYEIAMSQYGDRRSGRRLLCLPGILETREGFHSLIRHIQRTQTFLFDFAGRGESDHLVGAGSYRMSGCLRDACAAYNYVQGTFP